MNERSVGLFFRLFSARIVVEVHPEYFLFRKKDYSLKVETYLCLATVDHQTRIVSIGEVDASIPSQVQMVHLFKDSGYLPQGVDKSELLYAFFEYGIGRCMQGKILPVARPILLITGVGQFAGILCGYQRGLFENAALMGGAGEVIFVESESLQEFLG